MHEMSTFLAKPPAATIVLGAITNDSFYPDIDLTDVRESTRLDATVTTERLQNAVTAAMVHVNGQLRAYQAIQIERGFTQLLRVPSTAINGESVLITLYKRAIYCTVQADLNERYSDYDTTAADKKDAHINDHIAETQRRNAQWAINDLVGRTRCTVELI